MTRLPGLLGLTLLTACACTPTVKLDLVGTSPSALEPVAAPTPACDGKTDDTLALKTLMSGPAAVTLPAGLCISTSSIAVTAPSVAGAGIQRSIIQFPKETDGLVLRGVTSLSRFSVAGAGRCQATGPVWNQDGSCKQSRSGLVFAVSAEVEDVEVYGWSGHGIRMNCDINARGTNCNGARLRHPIVHRCSGDGILLTGSDANGVFIEQPVIKTNDGWGINSDAFIGPTNVFGGLLSTNKSGALRARGAATFVGVYIENASSNTHDKVVLLSPRAYLIGGNADVNNVTGNVMANGLMLGLWSVHNALGTKVWSDFGAPPGTINVVQQLRTASDSASYQLRWNPDAMQYEWVHANVAGRTALAMSAGAGLKNGNGQVIVPPGRAVFRDGIYTGSGLFAREFGNTTGRPSTGCAVNTSGAVRRNVTAKVGDPSFFQCAQNAQNVWAWRGLAPLSE